MKTFHFTHENQPLAVYKAWLKAHSPMNVRRAGKFNLLALYGALHCMQGVRFSNNLGIYLVSRYGPVSGVAEVLEKQKRGHKTTPFDFLNINSNNAAFYVAKALNANGRNMVVTTQHNHLDDGIALARLDMHLGLIDDALVGWVDESIDGILPADNGSTDNDSTEDSAAATTPDISHWVYWTSSSSKLL